jgi:predicted transcriptional regulator
LKDGTLSFSSLDFQDEQNSELAERYEIDSQTLIVQISNGSKVIKWKKLEKIWEYMNNYEKFRKYIVEEINEYLKEVKNGESKN